MSTRQCLRIACPAALFTAACITVLGCGKNEPSPGEPVSGKITVKGKPPGTYATLEFVSASDPSKKSGASVDPTGMFSGNAPLGKVKVALKEGRAAGPVVKGGGGGPPAGAFGKGSGPGGPGGPPAPPAEKTDAPPKMAGAATLPPNASNADKSGVEIDVPMGGAKDLQLDFTK